MNFIAIDLGSSSIKAALFDLDSYKLLEEIKIKTPDKLEHEDPNKFEISADEVFLIVKNIIDKLTNKYLNINGVLFSSQMQGFVYDYGQENPSYITWQDQRSIETIQPSSRLYKKENKDTYLSYLKKLVSNDEMVNNGVYFKPSLGLCNLFTLLDQDYTIPRNGTLYTLASYIGHKLCKTNKAHPQLITSQGFYDLKNKCINNNILQKLGFDTITFPEITKQDDEIIGTYQSNNQIIKIYPDFGDMQISILGSHLTKDSALINIATACQVICSTDTISKGNYEIRPYFEGTLFKTVSNLPSGRNLKVLINFIEDILKKFTNKSYDEKDIWKIIHQEYANESKGLTVSPFFYAVPGHVQGGNIDHITADNLNLSTLFVSCIQAMAQTYVTQIKEITDFNSIHKIICAGGVSWKVPEILQEVSTITNKRCELSPIEDEALLGMFIMSLKCSQKLDSIFNTKTQNIKFTN